MNIKHPIKQHNLNILEKNLTNWEYKPQTLMAQDPLNSECHLSSPTKILFFNKIKGPGLVSLMNNDKNKKKLPGSHIVSYIACKKTRWI